MASVIPRLQNLRAAPCDPNGSVSYNAENDTVNISMGSRPGTDEPLSSQQHTEVQMEHEEDPSMGTHEHRKIRLVQQCLKSSDILRPKIAINWFPIAKNII